MEREKKYFICLNRMQLTVSELTKPTYSHEPTFTTTRVKQTAQRFKGEGRFLTTCDI